MSIAQEYGIVGRVRSEIRPPDESDRGTKVHHAGARQPQTELPTKF